MKRSRWNQRDKRRQCPRRRCRHHARRRPRLVLQLHDELVFEVPTQDLATCALDVSSALEAATALEGVPAEVRLRAGPSWAALEPYDPHSAAPAMGSIPPV